MNIDMSAVSELAGFIGACLVDADSGLMLTAVSGGARFDLEAAGSASTDVLRAKMAAMRALGLKDNIEDILITLGTQYHLIRPLSSNPSVFIYVVLDRKQANLGMARLTAKSVEQSIHL